MVWLRWGCHVYNKQIECRRVTKELSGSAVMSHAHVLLGLVFCSLRET